MGLLPPSEIHRSLHSSSRTRLVAGTEYTKIFPVCFFVSTELLLRAPSAALLTTTKQDTMKITILQRRSIADSRSQSYYWQRPELHLGRLELGQTSSNPVFPIH